MATAPPEASDPIKGSIGYANHDFPIAGLKRVQRNITGFDEEGKSVFLSSDSGDFQHVMGDKQAIQMIMYSTRETPADLNDNIDIQKAAEVRVGASLVLLFEIEVRIC